MSRKSSVSHTSFCDERTPLIRSIAPGSDEESVPGSPRTDKAPNQQASNITAVVSTLLLAVFIANADTSLVIATTGLISSEFEDLSNSGWLITSYTLAMCASQPIYGKLCDVYGRKVTIQMSYLFFAIGCAICGLGASMGQVIFGRCIAGIGGAGINCLVSIIIADMVPLRQVATIRSYVNIAATTGRSLGGPIGGYLTDTIGWRWSFLGQAPITLVALALVSCKLQNTHIETGDQKTAFQKLKRIDFLGAQLLASTIVTGLLVLDLGGQRYAWFSPTIIALASTSLVLGVAFIIVEAYWAKEPVFPLRLLRNRHVVTSYLNLGAQTAAQLAMMFSVPLYFQVTQNASATTAGAHLMPSVIGNAFGGIISGLVIKRTGRYKLIAVIGTMSAMLCYTLLALRWRGNTSFWESLYIIPGGFGNGVALSASFISLTAGVEASEMAVASSGLFLSSNIGQVTGLSIATAVLQITLRSQLEKGLVGIPHSGQIIRNAVMDIEYVKSLRGSVGAIVRASYVTGLEYTHGVSLVFAFLAMLGAAFTQEQILN